MWKSNRAPGTVAVTHLGDKGRVDKVASRFSRLWVHSRNLNRLQREAEGLAGCLVVVKEKTYAVIKDGCGSGGCGGG